MKKIFASAVLTVGALAAFTACGGSYNSAEKQAETVVTEQQSPSAAALPREDFSKLPKDDEESLNYLSEAIGECFPDVSGRKMYGFKGVEKVSAGSAEQDCYIFDFYTYRKKTDEYTKIATVAQVPDSEELYVFDELTGKYTAPAVN